MWVWERQGNDSRLKLTVSRCWSSYLTWVKKLHTDSSSFLHCHNVEWIIKQIWGSITSQELLSSAFCCVRRLTIQPLWLREYLFTAASWTLSNDDKGSGWPAISLSHSTLDVITATSFTLYAAVSTCEFPCAMEVARKPCLSSPADKGKRLEFQMKTEILKIKQQRNAEKHTPQIQTERGRSAKRRREAK